MPGPGFSHPLINPHTETANGLGCTPKAEGRRGKTLQRDLGVCLRSHGEFGGILHRFCSCYKSLATAAVTNL